jgi:4-hydroxybenzoate polyprenyltransferase
MLVYALILQIIWFSWSPTLSQRGIKRIRIFFGSILPLIFAISMRPFVSPFSISEIFRAGNWLNFIPLVFLGAIFAISSNFRTKKLEREKNLAAYICAIVTFVMSVITYLIDFSYLGNQINTKFIEFSAFYLITFCYFMLPNIKNINKDREDFNHRGQNTEFRDISNFLFSCRPITSFLSGILAFIILFQNTGLVVSSMIKVIPIIVVTMLGFVFNDLYDIQKDKLANKNRPITTGELSKKTAITFAVITSILMLSFELLVNNIYSFYLILGTLIAVILYSPFSKAIPLLKIVYTAFLCCAPLLYGYLVSGINVELIKFLPILLFIIGRELWLDEIDLIGDLKANIKTLAYYLGKKKSIFLAFTLMFLSSGFIFLSEPSYLAIIFSVFSVFSLLICLIFIRFNENVAVNISRVSMLLGMFALMV